MSATPFTPSAETVHAFFVACEEARANGDPDWRAAVTRAALAAIAPALSREYAAHVAQQEPAPTAALSCPFCGSVPTMFGKHGRVQIACDNPECCVASVDEATRPQALDVWNRRAPAAPVSTDTADAPTSLEAAVKRLQGEPIVVPPELAEPIRAALKRLDAADPNEDIDAWAQRLAEDVCAVAPPASQPDATTDAREVVARWLREFVRQREKEQKYTAEEWELHWPYVRDYWYKHADALLAALGSRGGATAAPATAEPTSGGITNCRKPMCFLPDGHASPHRIARTYQAATPPVREGAPE